MRVLIFICLLAFQVGAFAQQPTDSVKSANPPANPPVAQKTNQDERPVIKRISFGGSTSFWIDTRKTHVEVAPLFAYHFPKILTTGVGYRYIFTRDRFYGKNLNSYGPNLFARAQLTKRIYLWSEWEHLYSEYALAIANNEITTQKQDFNSFFAGLGYIRQLGRRKHGGFSMQLLYNFLYDRDNNSPYYGPVTYRVGYFF
ncbi:MAG TPA: hypothetical protein VGQ59_04820 [Cyclobacteriaceae bacterium]|jgi:hypothetical protein|nr:hypothetical protein [Cyclobacteriaceae bacterium]